MEIIELTKEEFAFLLMNPNHFSRGGFGRLTLIGDKLYKIYDKELTDLSIEDFDTEIDAWIESEKELAMMGIKRTSASIKKTKEFERLESTMSSNLITGVLSYNGLCVGVQMNYFANYITLKKAAKTLSKEQISFYLNKAYKLISDLIEHDIVPGDIKENNILVNIDTNDVVLIDLDGAETIYGPAGYVKDFPNRLFGVNTMISNMEYRLKQDIKAMEKTVC